MKQDIQEGSNVVNSM